MSDSEPAPPVISARVTPHVPKSELLEQVPARCRHGYGSVELKLCLPTPRHTLVASLIVMLFLAAGLIILAVSEQGLPGVPKSHGLVLLLRTLGWNFLYFVPVHSIAICNLRGFVLYAINPGDSVLVCNRTALGPAALADFAAEHGCSYRRAWYGGAFMVVLMFLLNTAFFSLYLGEENQHPGFILAYGIGHIVVIVVGEGIGSKCNSRPLDEQYSSKMGPCSLGPAVVGFFIATSGYGVAKRYTGPWLGVLMPGLLCAYELVSLHVIANTFSTQYVQEKHVRQKYAHTNQGVAVSVAIAMVHAMAEGARLTLILVDIAHDDTDFGFLVPVVCGVAWNVLVRAGYLDRAAAIITCGWRTPTNCSLLLQEVKYCMGYPRFFAVAAIALARLCTLNEVLPKNQEFLGWALLAMFVAEVVEDMISWLLDRLDMRVHPKPRQITDEEVEVMVVADMKSSHDSVNSHFNAIIPKAWLGDKDDGVDVAPAKLPKELQRKCWKLRQAFDFAYKEVREFRELPFWAHFTAVAVAQFHTVLFLIILSNGLNYVLGFCPESGYSGVGRGLVWWPVTDPEDLCSGG